MKNELPQKSTLVALIVGDEATYVNEANALLVALNYFAERDTSHSQIIIVVDGADWFARLKELIGAIKNCHVIVMPEVTHLPGRLANKAFEVVDTATFSFVMLGTEISTVYANRDALLAHCTTTNATLVAGYRSAGDGCLTSAQSFLVHQDDQFSSAYPHAWLQMLDLVPMGNMLITTARCRQLGGFTEAKAMQRMWWWEFCLRASRFKEIHSLPLQPVPTIGWHHLTFAEELSAPVDDNLRVMMRVLTEPHRTLPLRDDEWRISIVPSEPHNYVKVPYWRALPSISREALINKVAQRRRSIRIAVLGGVNEPAHNQLCFF
ncbi:MAG: hypothetical protein HC782_00760 [Gammaproteobacteria bacterium]|nr:hypothetical protein [Gammaproteobacteria bacterium]